MVFLIPFVLMEDAILIFDAEATPTGHLFGEKSVKSLAWKADHRGWGGHMTGLRIEYFFGHLLVFAVIAAGCGRKIDDSSALLAIEPSPTRIPGETYEEAEARYRSGLSSVRLSAYLNLHSVKSLAVPSGDADRSAVEEWDSVEQITRGFEALRDRQFIRDPDHPSMVRRSTWLYPDNGCYARGELAVHSLRVLGYPQPGKIFAFGTLAATTPNTVSGVVRWWYHTAPIARAGDTVYVFDPAVEPRSPLELSQWLSRIDSGSAAGVEVSFCLATAYGPYSLCRTGQFPEGDRALKDQVAFLDDEWNRLEELGRDPKTELGDSPPW